MARKTSTRYAIYTIGEHGRTVYQHSNETERTCSWPTYEAAEAAIPGIVAGWNAGAVRWSYRTITANQLRIGLL